MSNYSKHNYDLTNSANDQTANLTASQAAARSIAKKTDSPFTHFEVLFCIYALLFYTEVWWTFVSHLGPVILLIRYSILGISMILLSFRAKTLIKILPKGKWLWLYGAVCILSMAWTINAGETLIGILQVFVQVSVFGLYFTSRFNPKHQLYILACALAITISINLFYVIALPSIGIHSDDKFAGAWKGIYANKNAFSGTMLWSMAVFYILSFKDTNKLATRLARIGLFISPILVILSTSKTALVLSFALIVVLMLWSRYSWQGRRTVLILDLGLLSTLVIVGGVISEWVAIVTGLGKDPTLSGRTVIWAGAIAQIHRKPLLGYGYTAFWTPDNPAARSIGDALYPGFYTFHSHNGFIDVILNVGWVGFAIFTIGFISTWTLALKYAYKASSPGDTWPLAVMILVTLYNTTESTLITDNMDWLFYVLAFLSVRIWPQQKVLATAKIQASATTELAHRTANRPTSSHIPTSNIQTSNIPTSNIPTSDTPAAETSTTADALPNTAADSSC